jgi:hypothetical protein
LIVLQRCSLSADLGSLLGESFRLLLCALEAAVELLALTVELRHLPVQSPDGPHKPQTKN